MLKVGIHENWHKLEIESRASDHWITGKRKWFNETRDNYHNQYSFDSHEGNANETWDKLTLEEGNIQENLQYELPTLRWLPTQVIIK